MTSKLKTAIKFSIDLLINLFIKPSKKTVPKSLLLIRLDAIGDYILFRNFIEVLKQSEKYRDYDITLLGNSVWKSLSEELDGAFISKFIWLDRNRFHKDFFYRYQKLQEIVSLGYEIVISPTYSREFFYTDTIVKCLYAKEKIGNIGDVSNIKKWQKNSSDNYYTKLIPAENELMFEFYRNKEFFENLLGEKLKIKKPTIMLKDKKIDFDLPQKYAILFIGASASYRKWNIEKFAHVAKYLKEIYDYEIILCGGSADLEDAKQFANYYKKNFIDLVGKTSLLDLLYVINHANLMIANETSAPHVAVALEMTNVFVIYNGNHYGRFTPYPKEVSENYHVIYHPEIEKDLNDYKTLSNSYGFGSDLIINEISEEMVKNKIDEVLK